MRNRTLVDGTLSAAESAVQAWLLTIRAHLRRRGVRDFPIAVSPMTPPRSALVSPRSRPTSPASRPAATSAITTGSAGLWALAGVTSGLFAAVGHASLFGAVAAPLRASMGAPSAPSAPTSPGSARDSSPERGAGGGRRHVASHALARSVGAARRVAAAAAATVLKGRKKRLATLPEGSAVAAGTSSVDVAVATAAEAAAARRKTLMMMASSNDDELLASTADNEEEGSAGEELPSDSGNASEGDEDTRASGSERGVSAHEAEEEAVTRREGSKGKLS